MQLLEITGPLSDDPFEWNTVSKFRIDTASPPCEF